MAIIMLTDQEQTILAQIAQQTGKTEDEILRDAIVRYLSHFHLAYRRQLLHEARGIWRDRTDLPDIAALRAAFDR